MRPVPWTWMSDLESGRAYLHLLTFFHLRSVLGTVEFFRMTSRITAQLQAAPPGLVGYAFKAEPLGRRYWTLSVWKDARSLMGFVREPPHRLAMEQLAPKMRTFDSVRWTDTGSGPPSWDDALRRVAEARRR
jgi:hypothetical protein